MNNDDVEKIIPSSPNFQTELAKKIAEIAPEVISDGKLDVTKLRELINGDVETATEKFGLFWPGKSRAQAVAQIPTSATLVPAPDESVDWENTKNIYIEGDNLEVLKALQNSYRRKVKMIYIDPPYNTGKEFIYPDNYQEGLQTYLEYTGQKNEAGETTESKKETGGRKHTNWLNMMYPRLQLAKSLLTDDGVIFISIDDNEQANLKRLCDEVFGEENLVSCFVWNCATAGGIRPKFVSKTHEYILAYAKNIIKLPQLEAPLSAEAIRQYNKTDNKGLYREKDYIFRNNSTNINQKYLIKCPDGELVKPKDGYIYRYVKETFDKALKEEVVVFKKTKKGPLMNENGQQANWNIYIKKYLGNGKGCPSTLLPKEQISIYNSATQTIQNFFNGIRVFDTAKPVDLIRYFLEIVTKNDSIIVDFFAGSCTTAHAVMQLNAEDGGNRTHIQVQLPEPTDEKSEAYKAGYKTISDIGKERIRRAGKKILADYADKLKERKEPLDIGFRVYKLAPSNFVQWDEEKAKENIQQSILDFAENKKTNATPEAILSEIMLQSKITLDAKIEKKQLSSGGWVYVVDDGNLIAYVDDKQITEDQAKEIADMAPGKLIVLDSAFNGNDALKINVANICKEKFIKEFKTI